MSANQPKAEDTIAHLERLAQEYAASEGSLDNLRIASALNCMADIVSRHYGVPRHPGDPESVVTEFPLDDNDFINFIPDPF